MTNYQYLELMEKQIAMLQLVYPRFAVYPTDTNKFDSVILNHAMDVTRMGNTFPLGLWPAIKRINNDCVVEMSVFRINEEAEASWDEDELEEVKARELEMAKIRRSMKAWEAEARLNMLTNAPKK